MEHAVVMRRSGEQSVVGVGGRGRRAFGVFMSSSSFMLNKNSAFTMYRVTNGPESRTNGKLALILCRFFAFFRSLGSGWLRLRGDPKFEAGSVFPGIEQKSAKGTKRGGQQMRGGVCPLQISDLRFEKARASSRGSGAETGGWGWFRVIGVSFINIVEVFRFCASGFAGLGRERRMIQAPIYIRMVKRRNWPFGGDFLKLI